MEETKGILGIMDHILPCNGQRSNLTIPKVSDHMISQKLSLHPKTLGPKVKEI